MPSMTSVTASAAAGATIGISLPWAYKMLDHGSSAGTRRSSFAETLSVDPDVLSPELGFVRCYRQRMRFKPECAGGDARIDPGVLAARQARCTAASLQSRQPIHQRAFQQLMADHGIVCSMSRSGNVWDNAAMESFFSWLKTERTARKTYRTRDEAKADVFDYIERFYNAKRRHSTIGYRSPMEFEMQAGLA